MAWMRYLHLLLHIGCVWSVETACGDNGLPAACYPSSEPNIIADLQPVASNTCGLDGPERVCYKTGAGGSIPGTCDYCDASIPELAHPSSLMTDPHIYSDGNLTYWQSQNNSTVQFPNSVVITFPLNKTFHITRIALTFQSPRPESYAIYKSANYGATFEPVRYYSLSCQATYGVEEGTSVALGQEAVALCTSEEAQMTPLSGGETVFQPLQFRPSAENFINSGELQEWVRATDLQLRLDRLNRFGDASLPSDPDAIDSYFYAISNVEVSGECFCNGHAASCSGSAAAGDAVCECEHNTAGPDCGVCHEFYQDQPWAPATPDSPTACVPCDCSNHSSVCRFDVEVYLASGNVSGGVCGECGDNTEGQHCQSCRLGYYASPDLPFTSPNACIPCECDPLGTVGGESSCQQSPSVTPISSSSLSNSQCQCKANVEGRRCSQCRDEFHTLDIDNPDGCLPCPACYRLVATEFNETLSRLSSLVSELNSSMAATGRLPPDLVQEILDYQTIVEEMLRRAQTLAVGERDLTLGVGLVAMDSDDLEDLIGQLERNVSLSEEGLVRITMNSDPTVQLLQRLQDRLEAVEMAVRGDLLTSLGEAQRQLLTAQTMFDQLVELSSLANETSTSQYELALSLLADAVNTSSVAQQALQLLSEATALQNETSVVITTLQEARLSLDSGVRDTASALREIEVDIPLTLLQARALLERVTNTSITSFNTTSLETRADTLRQQTDNLISDTATACAELEEIEREAVAVNQRATLLIAESTSINILAVELLGRAHAALSFANQTVEEGDEFIGSVEQLLLDLQQRLTDSQGFVAGLEEVMQNVERAEELAGEAEREGERRREEVRQAASSVEQAVLAMEEASRLTVQALTMALSGNEAGRQGLSDTTLLGSAAEELAVNVSEVSNTVTSLEGVATGNTGVITMATETAQTATSDANRIQGDIDQLLGVLEELQMELDSAELLPSDRLSEVGAMVTELESRAESNQVIINALQDQVEQLAESSSELRERHTSLQQHRDLLQTILTNLQNLDCQNQFQSF